MSILIFIFIIYTFTNNLNAHENPNMTRQDSWNRQSGRTKQGYVPDILFKLRFKAVLAELKTVNGQLSRVYLNANDERLNAINNRAKGIHRDIKRKLKEVDQKWNQSEGTIGPCEAHLSTYGKVKEWRLVPLANGAMTCTL
jgi:hypothetical protein